MAVTLLAGLHLTAHDKAAIAAIVAKGWAHGQSARKAYGVRSMGEGFYSITLQADGRTHALIVLCDDGGLRPSFEEASKVRAAWDANAKAASDALNAIPGIGSGPMGLTPDAVKRSPEYGRARRDYDKAADAQRNLTRWIVRTYPKEARAEAQARRLRKAA